MSISQFDFSDDLQITRFNHGIKLTRPNQLTKADNCLTLGYLKKLKFSVYFLDKQGKTQNINDEGALVCGFGSVDSSLGKSLLDVSDKHSAEQLIENCKNVIDENTVKIFDEINLRKDATSLQFLSIKAPWYDDHDNIIGVMGISIVLGQHAIADALEVVAKLGLLSPAQITAPLPNNIYLTHRELECLTLTIKGYTAKKIAKELNISHRTVEEYLTNIRNKMGASSKSELIEMTIDNFLPALLSSRDESS